MRISKWIGIVAVLLLSPAAWAASPDLILHGGRVFTSNPNALWAEAVAIRGHHVVAAGKNTDGLRAGHSE